ncbi:YceI family protein [Pseudoduganella namucuonensis]|uniref:Polyisoprenoid-binding protein YceI n=1 Tax=Pseudoduganella namucuonensis TaxID=1035707 RepID=A0A1I7HW87_9BURK|nr:YceI family protein [Pseudoduganella namucuonensis]SFU64985.1 Polyisoprenoid-binding protein YceI [Pseudoduganella namucuonensis]
MPKYLRFHATRRTFLPLTAALLAALLAACAPLSGMLPGASPEAAPPSAAAATVPPDAWLDQARAARRQVLRIDTATSLIAVTVRRGGALARLGHDHVIATRGLSGWAVPAAGAKPGRTSFSFRLDQMIVDDTELRAVAGLNTVPSADAISGTRNNMLVKVLDAEQYPEVRVVADTTGPGAPLETAITLHGVTRHYAVPATLSASGGRVTASGTVQLKQSDFGIKPFSVLGGALAVQDEMELRFEISAVKAR